MDNRILAKFYNYINVADKSKSIYPKIYYFIKTYAFRFIYEYISNENFPYEERMKIIALYNAFREEKENDPISQEKVTKEEYDQFLEFFFSKMDFCNLDMLYVSKDMLEIILCFGSLDKLSIDRMQYFNKKIAIMSSNKAETQNTSPMNNINLEKTAIPEDIAQAMSQYNLPVSKTDLLAYGHYVNEIISIINSANCDLDIGGFNIAKAKMEAALYYLTQITP